MEKGNHQQIVDTAITAMLDDLFPYGEGSTTRPRVQYALNTIAQKAFSQGESYALLSLLTTAQVAAQLHLSERRVRALAKSRNVGWQISRGTWLFKSEEVDRLRPNPPGRPKIT